MVDRIIFQAIYKVPEIGHLNDYEPVIIKQFLTSVKKISRFINMCKDVISGDYFGRAVG
jgi:hypothetical protein